MKSLASIKTVLVIITMLLLASCQGQTPNATATSSQQNTKAKVVGGPFENGEYLFIDMPQNIKATDTSPGWNQNGQKILITGTMYKQDGKTPAPNVIMYYYQTNINGYYSSSKNNSSKASRHGDIRGWVKSDKNGKYSIYTVRPAAYPNSQAPAHIHPSIKEPHIDNPYYIDEWVFDDDPFLTQSQRNNMRNRGGNGILKTTMQGNMQVAKHDIILGLNIPNYPH